MSTRATSLPSAARAISWRIALMASSVTTPVARIVKPPFSTATLNSDVSFMFFSLTRILPGWWLAV